MLRIPCGRRPVDYLAEEDGNITVWETYPLGDKSPKPRASGYMLHATVRYLCFSNAPGFPDSEIN